MKKILILTDQPAALENTDTRSRGVFSDVVGGIKKNSLEVDAATLAKDLKEVYQTVVEALSDLQNVSTDMELKDVQFTLGFDTVGQVSLLSSVSGSSTTKTGITFHLSFRK